MRIGTGLRIGVWTVTKTENRRRPLHALYHYPFYVRDLETLHQENRMLLFVLCTLDQWKIMSLNIYAIDH